MRQRCPKGKWCAPGRRADVCAFCAGPIDSTPPCSCPAGDDAPVAHHKGFCGAYRWYVLRVR